MIIRGMQSLLSMIGIGFLFLSCVLFQPWPHRKQLKMAAKNPRWRRIFSYRTSWIRSLNRKTVWSFCRKSNARESGSF